MTKKLLVSVTLAALLASTAGSKSIAQEAHSSVNASKATASAVDAGPSQSDLIVLNGTYKFGERSRAVRALQALTGAYVDGLYGWETYSKHKAMLVGLGLSTSHLPTPPKTVAKQSGPRYPSDKSMRCPKFEDELKEAGLPVDVFSYIAYRESRCNPKAVNARWRDGKIIWTLNKDGSYDSGLLQINSSWIRTVQEVCKVDTGSRDRDLQKLLDIDCNLKMAKWIIENTSGKLRNWSIYGG